MIPLGDLKDHFSLLTDGNSVSILTGRLDELTTNLSGPAITEELKERLVKSEGQRPIELLARLVAYDFVVADRRAVASLGIDPAPLVNRGLLRITEIHDEVYSETSDDVLGHIRVLQSSGKHDWTDDDTSGSAYHGEKEYFELLEKQHLLGSGAQLADSNESAARSFFYLEVSKLAEVPLLLSKTKTKLIKAAQTTLVSEAFKSVEDVADSVLRKAIDEHIEGLFHDTYDLDYPPLARYMLAYAAKNKISLLDAATKLRESESLASFRALLRELQAAYFSSEPEGMLQVASIAKKIDSLASGWVGEGDFGFNIEWKWRKWSLGEVPLLKWLKIFPGKGETITRLPMIGPESPYAFVSAWYKQ